MQYISNNIFTFAHYHLKALITKYKPFVRMFELNLKLTQIKTVVIYALVKLAVTVLIHHSSTIFQKLDISVPHRLIERNVVICVLICDYV